MHSIDFPHATYSEKLQNLVGTESCSGGQRHNGKESKYINPGNGLLAIRTKFSGAMSANTRFPSS